MGEPKFANVQSRTTKLFNIPTRGVGTVGIVGHTPRADSDYKGEELSISAYGNLTFATTVNTIIRSAGSWTEDNIQVGYNLQITGSTSNDGFYTVLTVDSSIQISVSEAIATEGPVSVSLIVYDASAIITGTDLEPKTFSNPTDIQDLYGQVSQISLAALHAIENGANPVICVPFSASGGDYWAGGTPGEEIYDGSSTAITEVTLTNYPVAPVLVFEGAVRLQEGDDPLVADFYVDYSTKKIKFHVARTSSAGSIQYKDIDYTSPGRDSDTAFSNLESKIANIITLAGAAGNSEALIALKDHIVATSTTTKKRIGLAALSNASVDITLASTLANDRMILLAHKSSKDIPSIVAGVLSRLLPQQDMIRKPLIGDASTGNFSDTEYNVTFKGAQIVAIDNSDFVSGQQFRLSESTTLSADTLLKYIDAVRVVDDVQFKTRALLESPAIIGELDLATSAGMRSLRATLTVFFNGLVSAGEINSYKVIIPLEQIVNTPATQRTPEETILLSNAVAQRTFRIDVDITYSGKVHYLDPVTLTFSGA